MTSWRATPEWKGETCFIVAGGPSVLQQDLTLLKGKKVIVINSSWEKLPEADFLIFSDSRWWSQNQKRVVLEFKGRIVSASTTSRHPKLLSMGRKKPPGLSTDPGAVSIQFTTLCSAINLAVHLGVAKIVLLGADGRAINGRNHHHAEHPWKMIAGCWDKQRKDLVPVADDLKRANIECVNASPESAWADIWPIVALKDHACAPCQ